jgi:hypothetical protein
MELTPGGKVEPRIYVIDVGLSSVYNTEAKGGAVLAIDVRDGQVIQVSAVYLNHTEVLHPINVARRKIF